MTKFLLALHVVFAIFAIGPLVHAATTAGRGIRKGDATATAGSARLLRVYGIASALVVAVGLGLMSRPGRTPSGTTRRYVDYLPAPKEHLGEFSETWIWLSLALWALALVLIFVLAVPALTRATTAIQNGESASALTGRVAAAGGVVGLIFIAITVLMVYRPGG